MLHGVALRYCSKRATSSIKVESVPKNIREFFSWKQKARPHRRNNFYFTAQSRRTDICCSVSRTFRQHQRARFVAFEKSAAHHDWVQLHVLNDTWTTGRATYKRERYIASIVEFTLILLCVRSTMLARQHVQHHQTVTEGSQIAY